MSVCLSRLGENVIFSAPKIDIAQFFFEHLFYKIFDRLSVGNATKALLHMVLFILVFYICIPIPFCNLILLLFVGQLPYNFDRTLSNVDLDD